MATYLNKNMVDGVEELPRLTQEEFEAIPVDERPKIWVKRNATETDRGITAEDVQYSSTQNTKQKIDSLSANDISYGASTVKNTLDNLVLNELEIFEFATTDGRYYTLTFSSISTTRFPIQIWGCRQSSAASVQMGSVSNINNNNQIYFTDTSVTYDRTAKKITIDLGTNSWGTAYLIARKGLLVKA